MTRGLRNNNPGNIRRTGTSWEGERKQITDPDFEEFETMVYGYRALIKTLQSYIRGGFNTIDKIINRWAPHTENDTQAYISAVEKSVGVSRFAEQKADDYIFLKKIAASISRVENGVSANTSQIDQAIELITKKKLKP